MLRKTEITTPKKKNNNNKKKQKQQQQEQQLSHPQSHVIIEDTIRHNIAQMASASKASIPCLLATIRARQGWMKFKFKARTDNWEGFFSHNHIDQAISVKALKKGRSKFWLPPLEETGIWKNKKRDWKNDAGAGLLKRGERLTLFLFKFFKVCYFYI